MRYHEPPVVEVTVRALPLLVVLAASCDPASEQDEAPVAAPGLCASWGREAAPFDAEGPHGLDRGQLAADVRLPTTDGPLVLAERWTGCEVWVFVPEEDGSSRQFAATIWDDDHGALLRRSPPNVHWVFFTDADDAAVRVEALEARMTTAVERLPADARDGWSDRLHFVQRPIGDTKGWVAEKYARTGYGFAVDASQRLHDIGSLADPERYDAAIGWYGPNLSFAANEAIHLNFVADREARLSAEADAVTVIRVIDAEELGGATRDVALPDAATMAGFDTLELDLTQACIDPVREFGSCPAWDYLADLAVCGVPSQPGAHADEACQPHVPGVAPADEVLGACHADGEVTALPCRNVDDCLPTPDTDALPDTDTDPLDTDAVTWTCVGYTPAVEAVEAVEADTLACTCDGPGAGVTEALQTCNAEGTGYGACACPCAEVGRWITTYHREGRWISDATHALPLLREGGTARLRYQGGNSYVTTLDLRLSRRGRGHGSPSELIPLFRGGPFTGSYNEGRAPIQVDVPADATHVELVALITGHGFGRDLANCAEFCDHTHHFTVNGSTFVKDHPEAGEPLGCMEQVDEGTVPNQFGTWFFGRGGWCPGKEVDPFVVDLDGVVEPGTTATLTYEGRLSGEPYVPQPANNGGFGANIRLTSYLVVWR